MKEKAMALAFLLVFSSVGVIGGQSSVQATIAVSIQSVIHIGLDNTALNWGTITKPSSYTWYSHEHLPSGNANCIKLIIYADTSVRVDIQYYGVKPTISAPSGDGEIEVRICNTTAGNSPVEQYGSYTAVPWLADLGPPAGSNLENDNI
ncbi:MAG: hypothetical protein QW356_04870, partial [Candidatus Hadarchaeales archaeon]